MEFAELLERARDLMRRIGPWLQPPFHDSTACAVVVRGFLEECYLEWTGLVLPLPPAAPTGYERGLVVLDDDDDWTLPMGDLPELPQ